MRDLSIMVQFLWLVGQLVGWSMLLVLGGFFFFFFFNQGRGEQQK